ncbi:MAG: FAD-dependent monooxygenase [Candidatus Dormibacteria bacterium]
MASISSEERILVVGGGPGGLALAIRLHDKGFKVELVERSVAWPASGGLGVLHANGIRVLDRLGLAEAAAAEGQLLNYQVLCDQGGTPLTRTELTELWANVGPTYGFDRPSLQRVLLSRAEALPCRLGTQVLSVEQGDSSVEVRFSSGEASAYALVVGADGVHSTIRGAVAVEPPVYGGEMYYRAVSSYAPVDQHGVRVMLGDGCFFGIVPLSGGRSYGFGAVFSEQPERDQPSGRVERMRARFAGFGGGVPCCLDGMTRDDQVHYGGTERVVLPSWHKGRLVLVGDAAHCSQPMMAQGTSMALEDGLVLAEELHRHDLLEDALVAYENRRMARTTWVQEQTTALAGGLGMPSAMRNPFLSQRGDVMTRERFGPLADLP